MARLSPLAFSAWLEKQGIRVPRHSDRDTLLEADAVEVAIWQALKEIDEARSA